MYTKLNKGTAETHARRTNSSRDLELAPVCLSASRLGRFQGAVLGAFRRTPRGNHRLSMAGHETNEPSAQNVQVLSEWPAVHGCLILQARYPLFKD